MKKDKHLYLVETISIFRQRYVVEAKEAEHAADEVVLNTSGLYNENFREFSQKHIDETITSVRRSKRRNISDSLMKIMIIYNLGLMRRKKITLT